MNGQTDSNDNGIDGEGEVDGHEGDYCYLQVTFWCSLSLQL
jgi:hypothetical protein